MGKKVHSVYDELPMILQAPLGLLFAVAVLVGVTLMYAFLGLLCFVALFVPGRFLRGSVGG